MDKLVPVQTMKLDTLFDIVVDAADSRSHDSRENFRMTANCMKSEVIMTISSPESSKSQPLLVALIVPSGRRGRDDMSSGLVDLQREEVRQKCATIASCEDVVVYIGGEYITVTVDEQLTIRSVQHSAQ